MTQTFTLSRERNSVVEALATRLAWTLHDLTFEQDDLIDAMTDFYSRDDRPLGAKAFSRQVRACIEHDATRRLDQIQVPTLVVGGEQDMLTPPHMQRELARRIPNARLVLIRGAGHLALVEHPARYHRLVDRFLDEYDPSSESALW